MDYVKSMLESHPESNEVDSDSIAACIEACFTCEMSCTACADACLAEPQVEELIHCIRTNLDCADVCAATGRILSRHSAAEFELMHVQLGTTRRIASICAEECDRHADMHEHCRICMEACRRCVDACDRALHSMSGSAVA